MKTINSVDVVHAVLLGRLKRICQKRCDVPLDSHLVFEITIVITEEAVLLKDAGLCSSISCYESKAHLGAIDVMVDGDVRTYQLSSSYKVAQRS